MINTETHYLHPYALRACDMVSFNCGQIRFLSQFKFNLVRIFQAYKGTYFSGRFSDYVPFSLSLANMFIPWKPNYTHIEKWSGFFVKQFIITHACTPKRAKHKQSILGRQLRQWHRLCIGFTNCLCHATCIFSRTMSTHKSKCRQAQTVAYENRYIFSKSWLSSLLGLITYTYHSACCQALTHICWLIILPYYLHWNSTIMAIQPNRAGLNKKQAISFISRRRVCSTVHEFDIKPNHQPNSHIPAKS